MLQKSRAPERIDWMQAYYFSQMSKPERAAYNAMLECFMACAPSWRVPDLEQRALSDVYARLKLDHPEIFWVRQYSYRYTETSDYVDLRPEYSYEKSRVREQQKAIDARVTKLLRPILQAGKDEQERFIHSFICQNVRYDKLKKEYSHEVTGPLTNGVGVCEGMAKTVKLLCDRLGIGCIVVLCEADPEHGIKYRHAWNLVQMNGTWYHLDATFDNTLSACGTERFDYFNLCDEKIYRDHRASIYPLPACRDAAGFYYRKAGLSVTKIEDAQKRMQQALRKKQTHCVLHWRGGSLTREVLAQLLQLAQQTAAARNLQAACSVNLLQSVVCVQFGEKMDERILEEAAGAGENSD